MKKSIYFILAIATIATFSQTVSAHGPLHFINESREEKSLFMEENQTERKDFMEENKEERSGFIQENKEDRTSFFEENEGNITGEAVRNFMQGEGEERRTFFSNEQNERQEFFTLQRDERRDFMEERTDDAREKVRGHISRRFEQALENLTLIAGRIENKIDMLNDLGVSTSNIENSLLEAKSDLEIAKAEVAELNELQAEKLNSDSDNFEDVRAQAKIAKDAIVSVHKALKDIVVNLKSMSGEEEKEEIEIEREEPETEEEIEVENEIENEVEDEDKMENEDETDE